MNGCFRRRNARTRGGLSMLFAAALSPFVSQATAFANDAPGAPGGASAWTTGAKEGLGTSTTRDSKVWFTLCKGILTEVFYPQADTPNVQDFQMIVSDGQTFVDLERDATTHTIQLLDPQALLYRQINTANSMRYRITKTYVTDPSLPTVLIQVRFEALSGGPYQLYVLYNPSLANSGMGDSGATSTNALVANDGSIASALACSTGFQQLSSGYSGTNSDGLVDLQHNKQLTAQYDTASVAGNLVQIGQIAVGADTTFVLALGFGSTRDSALQNVSASLQTDFATLQSNYAQGWHQYLAQHKPAPACCTANGLTTQYNVALMALKAHEDKFHPGAHVASLTTPWGDVVNADQPTAGYHRVWSRDLYEVASTMLAAGDEPAALASLKFLLSQQEINTPTQSGGQQLDSGAFPRFSTVSGTDLGCCEQLDEDAFPLILAWQLGQNDAATWNRLKLIADHITTKGAATPQERWEEQDGLSPSTLAAEIAGLVCAGDIARANGDTASATRYETLADQWQSSVETWTYTTTGYFGDHQYYERIDHDGNPNDMYQRKFGNDLFWERDILDAGFLELVRLGVKPANDAKIAHSLTVLDTNIKVVTPSGEMFHRYNHDTYGEAADGSPWNSSIGVGRLWPLLSGERGEYELANGQTPQAIERLKTMGRAANDGYLIPEQCWDQPDAFGFKFGKGTGSATPLAWSMAQFVRLALSIDAGHPVETPSVVANRYRGP